MTYKITSITHKETCNGTLDEAIERAKEVNAEFQPAYGVQVEDESGNTVWDSEEPTQEFDFCTDGESGKIEAVDFADACSQLREMLTDDMLADGAWGWVEDENGERYEVRNATYTG